MLCRGSIAIAGLLASVATAQAFDDVKYPDLFGVWRRVNLRPGGQPSFDPTKPWGRGQQAPLTPEYQAIHEASLADQVNGGQGNWQGPGGRVANVLDAVDDPLGIEPQPFTERSRDAAVGLVVDEQIDVLQKWVEQGAIEGASDDLPPAPNFVPGWQLGQPDKIIEAEKP